MHVGMALMFSSASVLKELILVCYEYEHDQDIVFANTNRVVLNFIQRFKLSLTYNHLQLILYEENHEIV